MGVQNFDDYEKSLHDGYDNQNPFCGPTGATGCPPCTVSGATGIPDPCTSDFATAVANAAKNCNCFLEYNGEVSGWDFVYGGDELVQNLNKLETLILTGPICEGAFDNLKLKICNIEIRNTVFKAFNGTILKGTNLTIITHNECTNAFIIDSFNRTKIYECDVKIKADILENSFENSYIYTKDLFVGIEYQVLNGFEGASLYVDNIVTKIKLDNTKEQKIYNSASIQGCNKVCICDTEWELAHRAVFYLETPGVTGADPRRILCDGAFLAAEYVEVKGAFDVYFANNGVRVVCQKLNFENTLAGADNQAFTQNVTLYALKEASFNVQSKDYIILLDAELRGGDLSVEGNFYTILRGSVATVDTFSINGNLYPYPGINAGSICNYSRLNAKKILYNVVTSVSGAFYYLFTNSYVNTDKFIFENNPVSDTEVFLFAASHIKTDLLVFKQGLGVKALVGGLGTVMKDARIYFKCLFINGDVVYSFREVYMHGDFIKISGNVYYSFGNYGLDPHDLNNATTLNVREFCILGDSTNSFQYVTLEGKILDIQGTFSTSTISPPGSTGMYEPADSHFCVKALSFGSGAKGVTGISAYNPGTLTTFTCTKILNLDLDEKDVEITFRGATNTYNNVKFLVDSHQGQTVRTVIVNENTVKYLRLYELQKVDTVRLVGEATVDQIPREVLERICKLAMERKPTDKEWVLIKKYGLCKH